MNPRQGRYGLILIAAVGLVAAFRWPDSWGPYALPMLLGALWIMLAVVLAGEFALLKILARRQQAPVPALHALLAAWWQELWAMYRLMVWRLPLLSQRSQPAAAAGLQGPRGVVLVHGYGCNRGIWSAWLAQMRRQQIPCIAINLEPLFGSIDNYGHFIEAAVADLQQRTGQAPVLVAHSMGGLAARAWWVQDPTASRLHRLITIGSPHQGTLLARFGWGANVAQMRVDAEWLVRLRAQDLPAHAARTICFYSDGDTMVIPSAHATLPGADNRQIPTMGHVAMVDHPGILAAALQSLRQSD